MEKRGHGEEVARVVVGGKMVWIRFRENETPGVREKVRDILMQAHEERFSEYITGERKIS